MCRHRGAREHEKEKGGGTREQKNPGTASLGGEIVSPCQRAKRVEETKWEEPDEKGLELDDSAFPR